MKILMILSEPQQLRIPHTYKFKMKVWRLYRRGLVLEVEARATLNPRAIQVVDILSAQDTTGEPVTFSDAEGTLRMARREHVSVLSVGEPL